ncbi:hypothetical protein [Haloprofundus halophilus]|uniref:hypothetical protein n=1 Tax=Haloprofundus halophilus TaxID=2283527 RepID=UPI000E449EFC|nr:hypothetical protein [Haloprofundus halophilus]
MARTLLRVALVLLLLFVAVSVLGFLVGLVATIVRATLTLLVVGAVLYGSYRLFSSGGRSKSRL